MNDFNVDQVWNHIGFMRLHDAVFILYRIHVRIYCYRIDKRKNNMLRKHSDTFEFDIV